MRRRTNKDDDGEDLLYSNKWRGVGGIFERVPKGGGKLMMLNCGSVVTRIVSSLCNASADNVVQVVRRRRNVMSAKAGNRQWDKRPVGR